MKCLLILIVLSLILNCAGKNTIKRHTQTSESKNVRSKQMLDGRVWMTENLDLEIAESYCQQDDSINCNKYGRLYTWEAAKKGCDLLGEGWRLPTNKEWQTMAKNYGGIYNDSDDKGKLVYLSLSTGGKAEFNGILGGNREANGSYERFGAHGFYWTATEYDNSEAWFYNFAKRSALLNRHTGDKKRAFSVRCIKGKKIKI